MVEGKCEDVNKARSGICKWKLCWVWVTKTQLFFPVLLSVYRCQRQPSNVFSRKRPRTGNWHSKNPAGISFTVSCWTVSHNSYALRFLHQKRRGVFLLVYFLNHVKKVDISFIVQCSFFLTGTFAKPLFFFLKIPGFFNDHQNNVCNVLFCFDICIQY